MRSRVWTRRRMENIVTAAQPAIIRIPSPIPKPCNIRKPNETFRSQDMAARITATMRKGTATIARISPTVTGDFARDICLTQEGIMTGSRVTKHLHRVRNRQRAGAQGGRGQIDDAAADRTLRKVRVYEILPRRKGFPR